MGIVAKGSYRSKVGRLKHLFSLCLTTLKMNIFRATRADTLLYEQQVRFIHERIVSTEDDLSGLCQSFGVFSRKSAKMRDASDALASTLFDIATKETVNRTSKKELSEMAENLAVLGDYWDDKTSMLDTKVLLPLSRYGAQCRTAKTQLDHISGARQRETTKRRQLGKIREKTPGNIRSIMKAESDLAKSTTETSQMQKALEEHMEIFEKKKLKDVKQLLLDFVKIELSFHADAVQLFTKAYKDLLKIDVESDFTDFKEILNKNPSGYRLETVCRNSAKDHIGGSLSNFLRNEPPSPDNSERTSVILRSTDNLSYDEEASDEETEIESEKIEH